MIVKSQQRFKSEKHTVFTEEVNKIPLSANDDKRIQEISTIETYIYRMSKDLVCRKQEIKCKNKMKNTKNN